MATPRPEGGKRGRGGCGMKSEAAKRHMRDCTPAQRSTQRSRNGLQTDTLRDLARPRKTSQGLRDLARPRRDLASLARPRRDLARPRRDLAETWQEPAPLDTSWHPKSSLDALRGRAGPPDGGVARRTQARRPSGGPPGGRATSLSLPHQKPPGHQARVTVKVPRLSSRSLPECSIFLVEWPRQPGRYALSMVDSLVMTFSAQCSDLSTNVELIQKVSTKAQTT
jgi:hypothetical protein